MPGMPRGEDLRLTREQLEFISRSAPVFVAHFDRERRYRFVNRTYARRFDRRPDQIVGKFIWEIIGDEAYAIFKPYIDLVLAGQTVDFESEAPYSVVGTHIVRCAYAPEIDEVGNIIGFVAVISDVTERRQAQEQIRISEERLRLGLEAGNVGTWDWDVAKDQVTWSDRMYRFFGVEPGTFEGSYASFLELVHPEDRPRVNEIIAAVLKKRTPCMLEFRTIRPDGAVRWLSTTGQLFYDEAQRPQRLMGATIDVTARKHIEAELEQAKEVAEAASVAKDQFLAVLSHELRTPLTPVMTAAQLLGSDPGARAEQRDLARMICRNVELEARLIDDLLDLTRISRGKLELHFGSVDAHEKIRNVVEMCEADIRGAQLELEVDLQAQQHVIEADSTRVQQILWNLVKNAIKFTQSGGTIRIESENLPDGRLQIAVTDTGVGIALHLLPKIFDAFEQGSREVTRLFGGLGLGLTISKALTEAHGGKLTAHSDGAGKGSTFAIELPTSRAVESALAAAQSPSGSAVAKECRILLVEDHADTARAMARLLARFGYRIETADSMASALAAAGSRAFDIIISDLGLPDGSGHDLMRQLLSRFSVQGIALSGYGMEEDIARSRQAGFAEHLTKPVNIQQLRETIDRLSGGEEASTRNGAQRIQGGRTKAQGSTGNG